MESVFQPVIGEQEMGIVIVGVDTAGKTTVLQQLGLGDISDAMPVAGFNYKTVTHKNLTFSSFKLMGEENLKPLWEHFYETAKGIVFVVDCNDRDSIDLVRSEIETVVNNPLLSGVPVLVMANKQDLPTAMPVAEVSEKLNLATVTSGPWYIQSTTASSGGGLADGFSWLVNTMKA